MRAKFGVADVNVKRRRMGCIRRMWPSHLWLGQQFNQMFPKPAEASSQAFSSPPLRLHPFHWMYKLQYYAIFSQNDASDACNNVGSSCCPTRQQAIKGIDGIDFDEDAASK